MEKTVFDYSKKDEKYFFGSFFNLADNNIKVVKDLSEKRFKCPTKDFYFLFNENITVSDFENRVDFIAQYFPVVNYFDDTSKIINERIKYFEKKLKLFFKTIHSLRNFYTHYHHEPVCIDDSIFNDIEYIFKDVCQNVKTNRFKNPSFRFLLKRHNAEEWKQLIENKRNTLQKNKQKNKRIVITDKSIENAVINDLFKHLIDEKHERIQKYYIPKSNNYCETENKIALSQNGMLFLLCMFITKNESQNVLMHVKGFKNTQNLQNIVTHWIYTFLSFKGVKTKLHSAFDQESFLLQICDELSKVPDNVYKVLPEEKKNEYIFGVNENLEKYDNIFVSSVIRKRYEDKFNYFVLRFVDEYINMPNVKFQINLGNYVRNIEQKVIEGVGTDTTRYLIEKIKIFGKLSDITRIKHHNISQSVEDRIGWELYPNPSFNIIGNNIPIFANLQNIKDIDGSYAMFGKLCRLKKNSPQRNVDSMVKEIDENLTNTKNKIDNRNPTALFSLSEMKALLFMFLVEKENKEKIETKIITKIIQQFNEIENFDPTQNNKKSNIPKRLQKSLSDKVVLNKEKLLNAIRFEYDESEKKLHILNQHRTEVKNKKRKFVFHTNEMGKESVFIAKDLIRFMPKKIREEHWRSRHHTQLQKSLAYFNTTPKESYLVLSSFWDFSDTEYYWNSSLKNILYKSTNFEHLFEQFYEFKKHFFNEKLKEIENIDSDSELQNYTTDSHIWNFFHENKFVINQTETIKERLLSQSLSLPRGIFDDRPTYIKGVNIDEQPERFSKWYRHALKSINGNMQSFYTDSTEEYIYDYVFNKEKESRQVISENKKNLSEEAQKEYFIRKYNQSIKQQMIKDVFLKHIVDYLFQEIFNIPLSIELKDFSKSLWEKEVPIEYEHICEPQIKLKDFGKLKRYMYDERVTTMFSYNNEKDNDCDKKWNRKEIEDQIESYETLRSREIFKEIQEFEKIIVDKSYDGILNEELIDNSGNLNFKLYIEKGIVSKYSLGDDCEISLKKEALICIRNKFAHNQLPDYSTYNYLLTLFPEVDENSSYAEQYLYFLQKLIHFFKCKIEQQKIVH
ncbi:MAG: type VI-B CRISPR-associated RNA-guided ribonuclease Cas13b [Bacteroidales bacterium]